MKLLQYKIQINLYEKSWIPKSEKIFILTVVANVTNIIIRMICPETRNYIVRRDGTGRKIKI